GDVSILCDHSRSVQAVGKYVIQREFKLFFGIEAHECVRAGGEDVNILERNTAVDREQVTLECCVVWREDQGVRRVADAHVAINDIVNQAATAVIGLDSDPVKCAINGQVVNEHVVDAAAGPASNRHTVTRIEVVVQYRNIGRRSSPSRRYGDAV